MNSIDSGVTDAIWRRFRSGPATKWESTFRNAVLMFSDQQLVTGIAILASGYAQLPCGLSSFHWQMIVYLAWFSSLTHLTTLTVLRQFFRDNPTARLWRVTIMLLMATMLGIALLPTGDALWFSFNSLDYSGIGLPALCYFRRLVAHTPGPKFDFKSPQAWSMVISVVVLFLSYLMRLIKLSVRATAFTRLWIRSKPSRILRNALDDSSRRTNGAHMVIYWRVKQLVLETVYVFLRASFDIYESTLWEVNDFLDISQVQWYSCFADSMASFCPHLGYKQPLSHTKSHEWRREKPFWRELLGLRADVPGDTACITDLKHWGKLLR